MSKIFLDDVRFPKDCIGYMYHRIGAENPIYLEEWVVVRNYEEFKQVVILNYHKITHVSFDHDLADEHYDASMYDSAEAYNLHIENSKEKTGCDCAKWMKWFYEKINEPLPTIYVHSMNPVGMENIINVFK